MLLDFVPACAFEVFVLLPSAWAVSYPETAWIRTHQAVTSGMEAEGKGARKMLGVQTDSWSSHTSTLELVQSHAVRWLQSCDAASKVTAPWAAAVGRCSHPWAAAGEEMPALTFRTCAVLNTQPAPPVLQNAAITTFSTREVHSEEETL